jgi:hypothetical protein
MAEVRFPRPLQEQCLDVTGEISAFPLAWVRASHRARTGTQIGIRQQALSGWWLSFRFWGYRFNPLSTVMNASTAFAETTIAAGLVGDVVPDSRRDGVTPRDATFRNFPT